MSFLVGRDNQLTLPYKQENVGPPPNCKQLEHFHLEDLLDLSRVIEFLMNLTEFYFLIIVHAYKHFSWTKIGPHAVRI